MHARVTIVTGGAPRVEQGIADFRNEAVPAAREMDGQGRILLVDRESGKGIGIALWPDEAALNASEERANELRRRVTEHMAAAEQPRVERYEVAVFEIA